MLVFVLTFLLGLREGIKAVFDEKTYFFDGIWELPGEDWAQIIFYDVNLFWPSSKATCDESWFKDFDNYLGLLSFVASGGNPSILANLQFNGQQRSS